MPRDRRRGRKPHHRQGVSGAAAHGQRSSQPTAQSKPVSTVRAAPTAPKGLVPAKQLVMVNPHLGRDLRNIGIVASALVALLIVLATVI